ncbi:MAG: T9SS type A sorting domain-containing protein [Bacteroidales bacterium]|nr:T9SS type A sorting domain-containing protein [Bacteroidales bacterium]
MKGLAKFTLVVYVMMVAAQLAVAQTPTTQDCLGAIPVCDFIYIEDHTANGHGNYNEIPSTQTCPLHCMDGEKNSRWYIFTVLESGVLRFEITPQTSSDDYDWSVFNLTNHDCGEIWSNPGEMLVSCNAAGGSGYQGATGISTPHGGTNNCNGGGPTAKWNADLVVWAGSTYVLVVSDWTQTPGGYTLDFSASTAAIFDDQRPFVEYVGGDLITACGSSEIVVRFNENVKCATVQATDFILTGPGGPYTIESVLGYNCDLGGSNEREYTLTISPAIYQGGEFELGLSLFSAISDACNNYAQSTTVPFSINLDTPDANAGDDISIAYAGTATLQGSASGGSGQFAYYWEPADLLDDPTSQTPTTINLTTSTAFYLLVSDQESACQSQDTMWVNVVGGTLGLNTTASAEAVCSGERVDLVANTGGGSGNYSYLWSSNPPGLNSSQQTASVYPTVSTWFKVVVNDGYTQLSDSVYVVVYPSPLADAGPDQVINEGTITTLNGSVSGGSGNYIYHWEPVNWLVQNDIPNPTTLPLYQPTVFTLIATDGNGCPSDPSQVLINPAGDGLSAFPLADPVEICNGDTTHIDANATGGGIIYTYEWTSSPPGDTLTQPSIDVAPDVTTRYDLVLLDEFGNEFTAHVVVTVNQLPVINLIPDGYTALDDGGDNIVACVRDSVVLDAGNADNPVNTEYYWLKSSYVSRYFVVKALGNWLENQTHSVRVTNETTGCKSVDSITIMFDFGQCNIDIQEHPNRLENAISIFPNPNHGSFTLAFNESLTDVSIEVCDIIGQVIYRELLSGRLAAGYSKPVNIPNITAGVYIIRLQNKQDIVSKRMIIQ